MDLDNGRPSPFFLATQRGGLTSGVVERGLTE